MADENLQPFQEQEARRKRIKEWVEKNLFKPYGDFYPEIVGPKTTILSVDVPGSLHNVLINGHATTGSWPTQPGQSRSAELFGDARCGGPEMAGELDSPAVSRRCLLGGA
jgi:hypothetical protein